MVHRNLVFVIIAFMSILYLNRRPYGKDVQKNFLIVSTEVFAEEADCYIKGIRLSEDGLVSKINF